MCVAPHPRSNAEADSNRLGCLDDLAFGRNVLDLTYDVFDRNGSYLVIEIADHVAKLLFLDQLHCCHAKTNAQNAIIRTRGAAPLKMAENHRPRFLPRALHDFLGNPFANAAMASFATLGCRAFGHHDQG